METVMPPRRTATALQRRSMLAHRRVEEDPIGRRKVSPRCPDFPGESGGLPRVQDCTTAGVWEIVGPKRQPRCGAQAELGRSTEAITRETTDRERGFEHIAV